MKITVTICVSDELCRLKEVRKIVSLCDSRIKRVRDRIAFLSTLTVKVVVLDS